MEGPHTRLGVGGGMLWPTMSKRTASGPQMVAVEVQSCEFFCLWDRGLAQHREREKDSRRRCAQSKLGSSAGQKDSHCG